MFMLVSVVMMRARCYMMFMLVLLMMRVLCGGYVGVCGDDAGCCCASLTVS